MAGGIHRVANNDHAIDHHALENGHHGCFLAARMMSARGKCCSHLVFHLAPGGNKVIKYFFKLCSHDPEIDRGACNDTGCIEEIILCYFSGGFYYCFSASGFNAPGNTISEFCGVAAF